MVDRQALHYQPSFPPGYWPGIGLAGCGNIVDVGTFPDQRIPIMRRALQAGKHILAQKPLALAVQPAREVDTPEFGGGVFRRLGI